MNSRNLLTRSLPFIVLAPPLTISLVMVSLRNFRDLGRFRNTVILNRAYVQFLVQLVSTILGLLNVLTVTTLINYATRIWLMGCQARLEDLSLWTAAALQKLDFNLSPRNMAICIGIVAVAQLPSALWTGSLTPVLTHHDKEIGQIKVPNLDDHSHNIWNSQFELKGSSVWNNMTFCKTTLNDTNGVISTCPVPNHRQRLLDHASQASLKTAVNITKVDFPTWIYHNRSLGYGSSVGVVKPENIDASFQLDGYCYLESSYEADVKCTKNISTAYGYEELERNIDEQRVIWKIGGLLPNTPPGDSENYPILTWTHENENRPVPVFGWAAVSNSGKNIIAITANERYPMFNQTQCEVFFHPKVKSVHVNQTTKSITVRSSIQDCNGSRQNPDGLQILEPTSNLTASVIRSIRLLSKMSTSLYVSDLGDALQRNLDNYGSSNSSGDYLRAVEEFFSVMIDDLLVAYSGAQVHFGSSSDQSIVGTFKAVKFGEDTFIFPLLAMNIVLFLIAVAEAVRTRFWHALPDFDHTKVQDLIVATFSGARLCETSEDSIFIGSKTGDVKVKLCQNSGNAAATLVIMYQRPAQKEGGGPLHSEEGYSLVQSNSADV